MSPTAEQEVRYYTRSRERMAIQKKHGDACTRIIARRRAGTSFTKNCRSYSEGSERSSSSEHDDEDIIVIEEKLSEIPRKKDLSHIPCKNEMPHLSCLCGKYVTDHTSLHKHILTEHPRSTFERCPKCDIPETVLCNLHMCRICNIYSEDLEAHLKLHYQDRSGNGALMECRICCKTFPTVQEVTLHERYAHDPHRPKVSWRNMCDYCGTEFTSQHLRDAHLIGHFEHILGGVWELVEQMQSQFTDQRMANQCPICFAVLGSRKSFKMHIIHRHLAKDPGSFMDILNRPSFANRFLSVKEVIQRLPAASSLASPVKTELKQESRD